MSRVPHDLSEEFPAHQDQIAALKRSDRHFAGLTEAYHRVNQAIHRAAIQLDPVETLTEMELRQRRAALKDQIFHYLRD